VQVVTKKMGRHNPLPASIREKLRSSSQQVGTVRLLP
jgi:hypothetical protein